MKKLDKNVVGVAVEHVIAVCPTGIITMNPVMIAIKPTVK